MSADPHRPVLTGTTPAGSPPPAVTTPAGGFRGDRGTGPWSTPHASSVHDADLADELAVRPFLLTGGRTRPERDDLRVESLIRSLPGIPAGALRFEERRIYDLCHQPASLADVAAALRVPLGVTRILVSDLIRDGYLALVEGQEISVQLLERIRDRVRAL
ncbi:MAG TPA: DUF742 domain-containing protein [Kineosporiaceae bacterium]